MRRHIALGTILGLAIVAPLWMIFVTWGIWVGLAIVSCFLLPLSIPVGIFGGFGLVALFWMSILLHHWGTHWLGRQVGAPLTGVLLKLPFGEALAEDESALPAWTLLYRSFGGPIISLGIGLVVLLFLAISTPNGGLWWLLLFLAVENTLLLGLFKGVLFLTSEEYAIWYWIRQFRENGTLVSLPVIRLSERILMRRVTPLFHIGEMYVEALRSTFLGAWILWVLFTIVSRLVFDLSTIEAILAGFGAMLLHYTGEILHHYGHFLAAKRTGYPMLGVRLWWVLGISKYPKDEGELPAEVHIRRALGGPLFSFGLGIVWGLVALYLEPAGGVLYGLVAFFALDNLLVFSLGAFLPLGFTDGSTILHWWGKRGQFMASALTPETLDETTPQE